MTLSVIIVAWRVRDKLRANLAALIKSRVNFDWEVFVVDNNSGDGTAAMVAQEFPQVKLMVNQSNLGFAKANNQAWREAQGDFVLLLNPDMKVFPDTLQHLVDWLKANPQAWVAGGRLLDEAGRPITSVRRFPTLADQLAIVLKLPHLFPRVLNKYLWRDFDYNQSAKVDSVRGSFFAVRRSTWEAIGYLDEQFFVWFEEVDYCRRVAAAGGEIWYTPIVSAIDYVGQSFGQITTRTSQSYFRDSMLKYWRKWQPASAWLLQLAWILTWPFIWLLGKKRRLDKRPIS